MPILSCQFCSCEFEAKTSRKMYCSTACKDKGKPSSRQLMCFVCQGPMVKSATSLPQGEAAHNACRPGGGHAEMAVKGSHGQGGYARGCRCRVCRAAKSAAMSRFFSQHLTEDGTGYVAKRRREFKAENGYWPQRGGGEWITPAARTLIYERDNLTCYLCGDSLDRATAVNDPKAPTIDHVIPRSKGGTDEVGNLKTCCRECNVRKSDSMPAVVG